MNCILYIDPRVGKDEIRVFAPWALKKKTYNKITLSFVHKSGCGKKIKT